MWFLQTVAYLFAAMFFFLAGVTGYESFSSLRDKEGYFKLNERIFWGGTFAFAFILCGVLGTAALYVAVNVRDLVVR